MNFTELWPALALMGVTGTLVALPFVPAWREWRRPQDDQALPLSPLVSGTSEALDTSQPSAIAEAQALSHSPYELSHTASLRVPVGTPFASLSAPAIWLGARQADRAAWVSSQETSAVRGAHEPLLPASQVLAGAEPWGLQGARLTRDSVLPPGSRVLGPLLVLGDLQLTEGCVVHGDIKAHGDITLAPRCQVQGALVAGRSVQLGTGSVVQGPVLARRHLHVARGVRIGTSMHPSTASADWVSLCAGSVVHGQVLAREAGVVL